MRTVSERAKLSRRPSRFGVITVAVLAGAMTGCEEFAHAPEPSYEVSSRRLVRLDADADRDGYVEQRTYLDGNVPFRTEVDSDRDGRVDRWEYVDGRAQVVKVGSSSRNDGLEDQWLYPAGQDGEQRVDRSSERTSRVDRHEFFRGQVLARAEEDTNQDGLMDKWETFDNGVLREAAYDTTRRAGRADRRFVYDGQGKYVRFETDDDGDGRFDIAATASPVTPGGRE